ncbi:hypothetical protein [Neobacillus mesonae]|uniref:hypothetical protein n=1 Tax=Neobacillus mesonae TaxID=1193713 RepID=UPI00203CFFA4|nr:hypothetical protein [Neobacillus mesonae]MCM3567320.1 hypothetical protein [Neobacillus mesonae]
MKKNKRKDKKIDKKTYKKKDSKWKDRLETFLGYFLMIDIPVFLVSLVLAIFMKDFLWQQIFLNLTIGSFGFIVIFGAIALIQNKAKSVNGNIFQKLFGSILALMFTLVVLSSLLTAISLYQDKTEYTNGEFKTVVGVAKNVTYSSPKHDPKDYLWKFEIKGKTFTIENMAITDDEYEQHYKGKKLSVTYLPESGYVIDLTLAEEEQ